jgi:putative heme iron utilization protein
MPADEDARAVVRALLARQTAGVLSTQSVARPGYPFGSGVSFALSRRGAPVFLLSELAAHTKNLRADARACLFVSDAGEDAQAVTRASLLGRAALLQAEEEEQDARERYRRRFADADRTFALGGFSL